MAGREEIVEALGRMALFADLTQPELEAAASQFAEVAFGDGQGILRQGMTGLGLYVITEGQCLVRVDGTERARLGRGEFFGELSVLLQEPPTADVIAVGMVRCLMIGPAEALAFLMAHPRFQYRMLKVLARRLANANRWRG